MGQFGINRLKIGVGRLIVGLRQIRALFSLVHFFLGVVGTCMSYCP